MCALESVVKYSVWACKAVQARIY